MRQVFERVEFLVGSSDVLSGISDIPAMRVFDDRTISFLSALSGKILKSGTANRYPDVVTFAFWCRKANLLLLRKQFDADARLGRGVAFHISPSNVPLNFAYSMAAGMLSGSANIIRLPSKEFEQTKILCDIIVALLRENRFDCIAERLCLVKYPHDKEVTDALSAICSTRVIWGGDTTISEIRKSPLPPRANDITFADRYSICVINADMYLAECDKTRTAQGFYNDTYLSDQNACTSPRILVWFGNEIEKAKEVFWASLYKQLDRYEMLPIQVVDKLSTFFAYAANSDCNLVKQDDYKIVRVSIKRIDKSITDYLENSGFFYEYDAAVLEDILPVCGRRCQTLSYIGFDSKELRDLIMENSPHGIDRIVPIGKTMDFSLIWDGHDLIRELSRVVAI